MKWIKTFNENVNKIIAYHGTNADFKELEPDKASVYNLYGQGIYLTTSYKIAKAYVGGILNRKTEFSRVLKCELTLNKIYDLDKPITDKEILDYKRLVKQDEKDGNYNFWFKRIYDDIDSDELPEPWESEGITSKNINRENLDTLAKLLDDGYKTLLRMHVFEILSDNTNTIYSKVEMINMLKKKGYDSITYETTGTGLSSNKLDNIKHRIYVCFHKEQIKIIS